MPSLPPSSRPFSPAGGGRMTLVCLFLFSLWSVPSAASPLSDRSNPVPVVVPGITKAHRDVDLSLQVRGRITEIRHQEGSWVEAGTIILSLDNRLEELEVEQRRLLYESRVELQGAKERERMLKQSVVKARKLYQESRSISGEVLEQKELAYLTAVIDRKRLEVIESREEVEYHVAEENLSRRFLRAPFDGVVTKIVFGVGESVEPNQPLVHLVDARKSYFIANVEERIGRLFSLGQKVDLSVQTGGRKARREGAILFISPVVDTASGLMEIKATFNNDDGLFRPGVAGEMKLFPSMAPLVADPAVPGTK